MRYTSFISKIKTLLVIKTTYTQPHRDVFTTLRRTHCSVRLKLTQINICLGLRRLKRYSRRPPFIRSEPMRWVCLLGIDSDGLSSLWYTFTNINVQRKITFYDIRLQNNYSGPSVDSSSGDCRLHQGSIKPVQHQQRLDSLRGESHLPADFLLHPIKNKSRLIIICKTCMIY